MVVRAEVCDLAQRRRLTHAIKMKTSTCFEESTRVRKPVYFPGSHAASRGTGIGTYPENPLASVVPSSISRSKRVGEMFSPPAQIRLTPIRSLCRLRSAGTSGEARPEPRAYFPCQECRSGCDQAEAILTALGQFPGSVIRNEREGKSLMNTSTFDRAPAGMRPHPRKVGGSKFD